MKHYYFVRHGQTHWNAIARMQGQWNSDLNDLGRQQADVNGQLLAGLTWPPGFAPGTGIYFQCLIADPSVPWGVTLSNALKGTTE